MLLNRANHVFVAKRIDMVLDAWQMPQGGIDTGEEPVDAAMRELREETGTDKAEILAEGAGWLSYDLPDDLIGKIWKGRYAGQRQKWFAMRFLGQDSDINIETEEPEFSAWRWAERHTLPDIIVPFKRQLYIDVLRAFEGIAA